MTQRFISSLPEISSRSFGTIGTEDVMHEPSLFSCSTFMVREKGGHLAKKAINMIQELYAPEEARGLQAGLSAVIDVRVQRLFPGMYPCIPGWHCDAVPRNTLTGQPNFSAVNPAAFHVCLLLSTHPVGVSSTEYVNSHLHLRIFDEDHVYRELHQQVDKIKPDTIKVRDGQFVKFDQRTIHRASPCVHRGWRMFLRYSMYHHPPLANGVSPQQQVYLLTEENGW